MLPNELRRLLANGCFIELAGILLHNGNREKKLSETMCLILPSHIMSSSDRDWFREETKETRARFLEEYVAPEDYHLFDV